MPHVAVVLAAGKGTRMRSDVPKVMHAIAGRPMLHWVLDAVRETGPDRIVVVVGHRADLVAESLPDGVESSIQAEQRGTGHAALVAMEHLREVHGEVLVVNGDAPLLDGDTLNRLLTAHRESGNGTTVLSTRMDDPYGYGRIVRDDSGAVSAVVEEKDADARISKIGEVNVGMYVFDSAHLADDLAGLTTDNSQGEYYLTDVVAATVERGDRVGAAVADEVVVSGVNTHGHLATAAAVRRAMINEAHLDAGVHMEDPASVYIDHGVVLAPGASILPRTHLIGDTDVAAGAVVGPDAYIADSKVGADSRVWYAVVRSANIGAGVEVGPFVSLRPETVLMEGSKAGTFVEIKKSTVGEGAKVPHLSYIGDASIGARSNIGAGTITVNYDGYAKHRTEIGEDVRIGSDTMLVAPLSVGDGAMTAAGSAITEDVEAGAMGIGRARQVNKPGFAARLAARYRGEPDD